MEGVVVIGAMIIGIATAFIMGFYVGNGKGYIEGMTTAAEALREIHEEGEEEIKKIEKEINPDCGWK